MSHTEIGAVAQRPTTPSEDPSSEIVCLVDDDPMVLRSTGLLLASDGFDVCPFNNGEDFIAYVASHNVPVVVLDIWMKGMNGLEVLARLCAISPQTHVIVITGHEDASTTVQPPALSLVAVPMLYDLAGSVSAPCAVSAKRDGSFPDSHCQ